MHVFCYDPRVDRALLLCNESLLAFKMSRCPEPYSLMAETIPSLFLGSMIRTRQAHPNDFLDSQMATVVRASINSMSVINTTTRRKLLHDLKAHSFETDR